MDSTAHGPAGTDPARTAISGRPGRRIPVLRLLGLLAAALLSAVIFWFNPVFKAMTRDRYLVLPIEPARSVMLVVVPAASTAGPSAAERRTCARLVDRCTRLGARVIVLHGVFPQGEDRAADAELADAVRRSGRVVVPEAAVPNVMLRRMERLRSFEALHQAARQTGVLAVVPDPDGVVRLAPLEGSATLSGPHIALCAARELAGERLSVPTLAAVPGAGLLWRMPPIPEIPLPAALLEGHDDVLAASLSGRAVVIELSRPEDRYPVRHDGTGVAVMHSAAWLTASWVEAACHGGFATDPLDRLGPMILLLLVAVGLVLWLPGLFASGILALLMALAGQKASGHLFTQGVFINGVGFAFATGFMWLARAASEVVSEHFRYASLTTELQREVTEIRRQLAAAGSQADPRALAGAVDQAFVSRYLPPRYENVQFLGEGGMGMVYRAHDSERGEAVALKVLSPLIQDNPHAVARFLNEARTLERLSHPGLVKVREVRRDVLPYISMELVPGRGLDQVIASERRLPALRAALIAREIAGVLAYIHRQGVIHRDIKPSNVMVQPDGVVKLLDFGVARDPDATGLTQTGDVVGSYRYMAPEQVEGHRVTPAVDVYALGAVFLEMLIGELSDRRSGGHTVPGSALLAGGLPPSVVSLLERLLAPDLSLRPPDGTAAAAELERILGDLDRPASA